NLAILYGEQGRFEDAVQACPRGGGGGRARGAAGPGNRGGVVSAPVPPRPPLGVRGRVGGDGPGYPGGAGRAPRLWVGGGGWRGCCWLWATSRSCATTPAGPRPCFARPTASCGRRPAR